MSAIFGFETAGAAIREGIEESMVKHGGELRRDQRPARVIPPAHRQRFRWPSAAGSRLYGAKTSGALTLHCKHSNDVHVQHRGGVSAFDSKTVQLPASPAGVVPQAVTFEVDALGGVCAYAHVTSDERRPLVAASPASTVEQWATTELTAVLQE